MLIESGPHSLRVDFGPRRDAWAPCTASVEIRCGEFHGLNRAVLFTATRLDAFRLQLAKLDAESAEQAQLIADDPRIFALTIDAAGAESGLQARGHLASDEVSGVEAFLEFRFPLKWKTLPLIAEQMDKKT